MESDETKPTVREGEILPPQSSDGVMRNSNRPMVVSLINKIRNQVLQKEIASYEAKQKAWNGVVAALRDGERLRQEYQLALVRSKELPILRDAEEAKILLEVNKIFEDEADRQLERNLRRTTAEAELIKAQRILDELKKPANTQPDDSRGTRRVAAIKRIREERDEMIAIIVAGRAESQLDEEDKRLVEDIRIYADDETKRFLEENRG